MFIPETRSSPKFSNLFILISAFTVCLSCMKSVVVPSGTRKHYFKMVNQEARHPGTRESQFSSVMKILWVKSVFGEKKTHVSFFQAQGTRLRSSDPASLCCNSEATACVKTLLSSGAGVGQRQPGAGSGSRPFLIGGFYICKWMESKLKEEWYFVARENYMRFESQCP